jgi:tRNA threonylcarbamoyl adenosine modification protein (Sua5/YciO/YrdC/YwlC family)
MTYRENGRETILKSTRILKLFASGKIDLDIIAQAAAALRQGLMIVIPTDTVYGVAACYKNSETLEMLRRVKNRPAGKPIPVLASDCIKIENIKAQFGNNARELANRFWPGPLTIVLPVNEGWEGFRIPNHPVALAIIKAAGGLLRVTSANLSGNRPALTVAAALRDLGDGVALAVDSGPAPIGKPSTVVKIENEKAVILREGAISSRAVYKALNQPRHE